MDRDDDIGSIGIHSSARPHVKAKRIKAAVRLPINPYDHFADPFCAMLTKRRARRMISLGACPKPIADLGWFV